jgi:hypothetical protein
MRIRGFEQRWAREVSRAFVGPGALGGVTADLDPGALFAEDCASVAWVSVLPIRLALWLVWWAPLFRHAHTFGGISEEQREKLLEDLLHSNVALVRMMVTFLKLICVSLLLGNARALAQIGAYGMRPQRTLAP